MRSLLAIAFVLPFLCSAQQFINPDLDGALPISSPSQLPFFWLNVVHSDSLCLGSPLVGSDTPDLTDTTDISPNNGLVWGIPHSGNTFVSGLHCMRSDGKVWHEGIMQQLNFLKIGCGYSINFWQSVIKQINMLEEFGYWKVGADSSWIGKSSMSYSNLSPMAKNDVWDFQSITFIAKRNKHIIKFLPFDGDSILSPGEEGVRMGIDSIHLLKASWVDFTNIPDTVCEGEVIEIDLTNDSTTYEWNDGIKTPIRNITQSGKYWVITSGRCGNYVDTLEIYFSPYPTIAFANNKSQSICLGDSVVLDVTYPNATYAWKDGASTAIKTLKQQGVYALDLSLNGCITSDSFRLTVDSTVNFNLGVDTAICPNESIAIGHVSPNANYRWQDGVNQPIRQISNPGNYKLAITNSCGNFEDSILVETYDLPEINFTTDTILCETMPLVYDFSNADYELVWGETEQAKVKVFSKGGAYPFELKTTNCVVRDTLNFIGFICDNTPEFPNLIFPNGSGILDVFEPSDLKGAIPIEMRIYDLQGNLVYITSDKNIYWHGGTVAAGRYLWHFTYFDAQGIISYTTGHLQVVR